MGVYLAKPATEKYSAQAASSTMEYGASSMQGWRTAQEDAHCCHLDVGDGDTSVFGVFDGHGGADISRFCADRLLNILTQLESYKCGNLEKALEEAFLLLDKTLLEDSVRQQLMEVRSKADQGKNGGLREDGNEDESSEASDVSGDDPDQLKAEAQMSMADLIARIVKPKKGSPFIYKKAEKASAGTSKLVADGETASPLTTSASSSSGRKRTWCTAKEASSKKQMEEGGSSSSSSTAPVNDKQQITSSDGGADVVIKEEDDNNTRSKKAPSGVGSPPSEPQEKRPMISNENENELVVGSTTAATNGNTVENGGDNNNKETGNGHLDGKCPDGPLADCKQKLNNASKQQKEKTGGEEQQQQSNGGSGGENGKTAKDEQQDVEENEAEEEEEEEEHGEEEAENGEEEASDESDSGDSSSQGEEEEEEESEDTSDDSDQIYKEMMEDELKNEDSSEDSNEDEDFESRKIRMKKMKALGLLGGAALRRSILTSRFVDDDSEENEDEEEEEDENAIGPLKVRGGPDIEFLSPPDEREPGVGSGATAIVSLVRGNKLYVANAGDSRCIVFKNGKTVAMSFDHKPDDAVELERITKAGGRVTPDGRVMGGLNLSRAIGDHLYKRNRSLSLEEQMVSSKPDLKTIDLDGAEFMVLACDGIWNSMTNEEVGEFVKRRLDTMSLVQICSEIFDHCLAPSTAGDGTGCDNMTAIIVRFNETNKTTESRQQQQQQDV